MEVEKTKEGVRVKNPMPYAPNNIRLSKADFVAQQKAQKEKDLKVKEFADGLDKPKAKEEVKPEEKGTTEEKKKPGRRPKEIK
ncbi:MAG: hypothetical protein PHY56_00845 [Candidatus Omnitrophica bacterium]|nr:hypothetical protein [Candidatus Omnitrophota bacterium]